MKNLKKGSKRSNNSWRYVSTEIWKLDQLAGLVEEEDRWIDMIEATGDEYEDFNAHDFLQKILTKTEYDVVDMILFDGLTFREAGLKIKRCKQRVWQIYKAALDKIKPHMN